MTLNALCFILYEVVFVKTNITYPAYFLVSSVDNPLGYLENYLFDSIFDIANSWFNFYEMK